MEVKHTNWEDLGISNDFLFGKVMQNPKLCKDLLQIILPDLEIDHIEYPELQKTIKPDADAKSIRLDLYIKDNKMLFITSKCKPAIQKNCQKEADINNQC